ncbi:LysR family transcriptional regulator [Schwartzia succinivorans]|uniref:LysR family transcriptional regulator n=1 Tax=Schwartzia succinivorans TaxID=55507 RepID=UPI000933AF3D|nr:LysR family transcriptional regulator [Schwartzia succinivorans]
MIDEHEWKSVLQVAADGSFSAAARHLFVSQPSLSQCIKKIEAELGTKLFDRSQTPLKLTAAGEIYLKNAKIIQHLKSEMVKQTTDLQHLKAGVLTIGSSRTRSSCFLKRPLIEFHRKYPGIRLVVHEHPVAKLMEDILNGSVDFALLYEPLDDGSYQKIHLLKEKTLIAMPWSAWIEEEYGDKQVYPYPKISFAKLHNQPFITLQKGRRMNEIYEKLCQMTKAEPDIVFEANSILDAAEYCAEGMGAALVTDMLAENWNWKTAPFFFEIEEPVEERHLVAAFGKNQHLSEAAKKFLELLKKE